MNDISISPEFDCDPLQPSSLSLSLAQINQAAHQASQVGVHPDRQWQIYLHSLAVTGFEQWLAERAPDLFFHQHCELEPPTLTPLLDTVCHLQVGHFRLCVITPGQVVDQVVHCPRAVIDLPRFIPHFYVLIEVLEEQEHVQVKGVLRRDQLVQRQQAERLIPEIDWTYALPLEWFEQNEDVLLLYLRGLAPNAIALPQVEAVHPDAIAQLQDRLVQLGPMMQRSLCQPWEVLTWEEGTILLQTPDLARQFYRVQRSDISDQDAAAAEATSAQDKTTTLPQSPSMTQRAINAALWLQDQLDQVAEESAWFLLPNLTPAVGLRSVVAQIDRVVADLKQQGFTIPPEARGAYNDLKWGGVGVRLYAVTWPLTSVVPSDSAEWSLLIMAGPHPDLPHPPGLRLVVRDDVQLLSEQALAPDRDRQFLYTQVIGAWNEQFWITIDFTNGTIVTLPPLTFTPRSRH